MRGRHARTLARILERPTRADVSWREVAALLSSAGAQLSEGAGSRVHVALRGRRAVIHRPHPGKEPNKNTVEAVRRFLAATGVE